MNYKKIRLSDFTLLLNQMLHKADNKKDKYIKHITPNAVFELLIEQKIELNTSSLHFWEDWEGGTIEITEEFFLESVLGDLAHSNSQVIVMFDGCFLSNEVYEMKVQNLVSFKETFEGDTSTLFEPLDHVFYFPDLQRIILLHHDGKLIKVLPLV